MSDVEETTGRCPHIRVTRAAHEAMQRAIRAKDPAAYRTAEGDMVQCEREPHPGDHEHRSGPARWSSAEEWQEPEPLPPSITLPITQGLIVKPGDMVLIGVPEHTSAEHGHRMSEALHNHAPGVRFVMVAGVENMAKIEVDISE